MTFPSRLLAVALGLALVSCATLPRSGLTQHDYRIMEVAVDAVQRKHYDEARQTLEPLLSSPDAETRALAYQTLGFLEADQKHNDAAIAAFHSSLATGALKPDARNQMLYNVGQLGIITDNCAEAVSAFEQWHAATAKPYGQGVASYLMVCYADQGRFADAAARYQEVSALVDDPSAAFRKIGADLELAKQGTKFPEKHFQRTLSDETYFRTRPVRKDGKCSLVPPADATDNPGPELITVAFTVDVQGVPANLRIKEPAIPESWKQAAIDAVMHCKFRPALDDGKPVKSDTTFTFGTRKK